MIAFELPISPLPAAILTSAHSWPKFADGYRMLIAMRSMRRCAHAERRAMPPLCNSTIVPTSRKPIRMRPSRSDKSRVTFSGFRDDGGTRGLSRGQTSIGFDSFGASGAIRCITLLPHQALIEDIIDYLTKKTRDVDPADEPQGRIVVGPAGLGKTHLIGELRRRVWQNGGFFVLLDLVGVKDFWSSVALGFLNSLQVQISKDQRQYDMLILRIAESSPGITGCRDRRAMQTAPRPDSSACACVHQLIGEEAS